MNIKKKVLEILHDKHSLRRLGAGVIGRSGLGNLFKIKIRIHDYYILFHPTGLCSLYWNDPTVRNEDYEFLNSFLKKGDTYIDVGANVGVTVIPAAKCIGESGRVIAVEPHPAICSYLKENIELNDLSNVQVHNCAVGNQKGSIQKC